MNCSCSPRYDPNCAYVKQADPAMTPTDFLNSILSACDASNWDADRNKGDYFNGLRDAYEAVQEIATDYQTAMYAWTRSACPNMTDTDLKNKISRLILANTWATIDEKVGGAFDAADAIISLFAKADHEGEQVLRKAREALLGSEGVPLSEYD